MKENNDQQQKIIKKFTNVAKVDCTRRTKNRGSAGGKTAWLCALIVGSG